MTDDRKRMRKIIEDNNDLPDDKLAKIVKKETGRVHSSAEIAAHRVDSSRDGAAYDNEYLDGKRIYHDNPHSERLRTRNTFLVISTIAAIGIVAVDYLKSTVPNAAVQEYITPEHMTFVGPNGEMYIPTSLEVADLRNAGALPDLLKMYEAQQTLPETADAFQARVNAVERRAKETSDNDLRTLLNDAVRSAYQDSRHTLQR